VRPELFADEAEKSLYQAYLGIRETALSRMAKGDYENALVEMARLRKPVDSFFEAVLVMAEDDKVRFNRLSLLETISSLFYRVADFSRIVTASQ